MFISVIGLMLLVLFMDFQKRGVRAYLSIMFTQLPLGGDSEAPQNM